MSFELESLREEINNIDNEILELLEQRMELSYEVGEYKKEHEIAIQDKHREEILLAKLKQHTKLDEAFIEKLFAEIIKESRRIQEHVTTKN